MAKRVTVVLEGNIRQEDKAIHEMNKLVDKADSQPELTASIQSESVDVDSQDVDFETAGEQ